MRYTKKKTKQKVKPKRKAKVKVVPKKIINPILLRARSLRSSLLRRIDPELKHTTPTIDELFNWLNREYYICYYSLEELQLKDLTIDHIQPLTKGGDNSLDNLCFASASMNRIKGPLSEKAFRSLLELVKNWDDDERDSLFKRLKMGHFGR